MLDAVLDEAADADMEGAVIGMGHRGRLNVLANTIGKSYGEIFGEFEGNLDPMTQGLGRREYHLGAVGEHAARSGKEVRVEVASNPSHLEGGQPGGGGHRPGQAGPPGPRRGGAGPAS